MHHPMIAGQHHRWAAPSLGSTIAGQPPHTTHSVDTAWVRDPLRPTCALARAVDRPTKRTARSVWEEMYLHRRADQIRSDLGIQSRPSHPHLHLGSNLLWWLHQSLPPFIIHPTAFHPITLVGLLPPPPLSHPPHARHNDLQDGPSVSAQQVDLVNHHQPDLNGSC